MHLGSHSSCCGNNNRSVTIVQKMRYVAAYMLAALGGNEDISAADIEKILSSVGIEAESDKLEKVISELKGKNLATLIAEGIILLPYKVFILLVMINPITIFRLRPDGSYSDLIEFL